MNNLKERIRKSALNAGIVPNINFFKKVGSGGYGDVYNVSNNTVVKVGKNLRVENGKREFNIHKNIYNSLKNKFIPKPKLFVSGNNGWFYFMEKMKGEPLKSFQASSQNNKNNINSQVKNKEQKLSNIGYIHGNLNPGNILIYRDPNTHKLRVFIIDFGKTIKKAEFNPNEEKTINNIKRRINNGTIKTLQNIAALKPSMKIFREMRHYLSTKHFRRQH